MGKDAKPADGNQEQLFSILPIPVVSYIFSDSLSQT